MKSTTLVLATLAAAFAAAPAISGYAVVAHGTAVPAAVGFTVTAGEDWNRDSRKPMKKAETWTLDGPSLNELTFVAGLAPGETLFREIDKKNQPLPKLAANATLTDIPEFFESSTRIARKTSLFAIDNVAPAKLGGNPGIRFTYHYAVQGAPLVRNGVATATLVKGQLYLIHFAAPNLYYYDRDAPRVEAIMASAKL